MTNLFAGIGVWDWSFDFASNPSDFTFKWWLWILMGNIILLLKTCMLLCSLLPTTASPLLFLVSATHVLGRASFTSTLFVVLRCTRLYVWRVWSNRFLILLLFQFMYLSLQFVYFCLFFQQNTQKPIWLFLPFVSPNIISPPIVKSFLVFTNCCQIYLVTFVPLTRVSCW